MSESKFQAELRVEETLCTSLDVRDTVERGQRAIEIDAHKDYRTQSFLQFLSEAPSDLLLAYWRDCLHELEKKRGLVEYHLKVFNQLRSGSDCWGVKVLYGEEASQDKDGPLEVEKCMSCDLDCPLSVGVGAGDTSLMSKDTLLESFEHHNAWIDAKARPLYVVTPKRHVRRLAELGDDELVSFWRNAGQLLSSSNLHGFTSMILNHGKFQNHAHLHLKIRVRPDEFQECVRTWSEERRAMFQRLKSWVATLPYENQGRGPPRKRSTQPAQPCRQFSRGQRFSHDESSSARSSERQQGTQGWNQGPQGRNQGPQGWNQGTQGWNQGAQEWNTTYRGEGGRGWGDGGERYGR